MELFLIDSQGVKRSANYVICNGCNVEFLKINKDIKRTKNHYCSRKCHSQFTNRGISNCRCAWCNNEFERKNTLLKQSKSGLRFCSVVCKTEAQSINGLKAITPQHYGTSAEHNQCIVCKQKTVRAKFCSKSHRLLFQYVAYITKWQNDEVTGNHRDNENLSRHVRRYMFEKHDSKCQTCGWNEVHPTTGKIPLTINHIDGDCANSKENNLELLCPNCHSLTSNYGSLNKGSGRASRRKKQNEK